MKVSIGALYALAAAAAIAPRHADGFAVPSAFFMSRTSSTSSYALRMSTGGEFDHIFGEGWEQSQNAGGEAAKSAQTAGQSRKRAAILLRVPDGSPAITHVASSITAPRTSSGGDDVFAEDEAMDFDAEGSDSAAAEERGEGVDSFQSSVEGDSVSDDPYIREIMRKQQLKQVQTSAFNPKSFLEGKDFTDIFFTVILPLGGAAYGAKWLYSRSAEKMGSNAEEGLDDYAREMCYHDGDFDEMKMCHSDYKKRLAWLGPGRKDRMIRAYLETFAKKVTVSPQSISSLSYAFSLYKLSEDRAAQILCDLCLSMPEKTASTGKLLFFGTHILKSEEAKSKLDPVREMLASSYRDDVGVSGEEIVDKSQRAMGEAAYRDAITKAGKNQDDLTVGWEVLGLDEDTARRIFDEEAEAGFVSSKEAKYSRAKLKYDDKGRRIDPESGKVVVEDGDEPPPEEEEEEEEEEEVSNVYECGECGYTLFVAEGRNAKFFGSGFTCPECGAAKDKFVGRTMGED